MADKHLYNNAGVITEREAITASAGAGDAGKHIAANGSGKIDSTFLPDGIGDDDRTFVCSENLAAGDLVNIHDDAGTPKVRKADASNGRIAHGYVKSAYTAGATATVHLDGTNDAVSGLTAGNTMYLSGSTAGAITATAPSTSGHIVQRVGFAMTSTELSFEASTQPVVLA